MTDSEGRCARSLSDFFETPGGGDGNLALHPRQMDFLREQANQLAQAPVECPGIGVTQTFDATGLDRQASRTC